MKRVFAKAFIILKMIACFISMVVITAGYASTMEDMLKSLLK